MGASSSGSPLINGAKGTSGILNRSADGASLAIPYK